MKQMIFIFSIFIMPLFSYASEFQYIQPVAVEEAPVKKIIKEQPKPVVQKPKIKDSDKDGVVDEKDRCPNTALGLKVDEEGCELDSDDDGVKDSQDRCPGTTKEFVVDGYGCPQTATLRLHFDTNSYAISEELIDDLKGFALFLQNNIGYKVIIYGHTDSNGTDMFNKKLSQNRANSVKEALVRYGIDELRLTAIGKGETEPVANNNTKDGRAENRRIEVELLQ